jgi:hypothetical protein
MTTKTDLIISLLKTQNLNDYDVILLLDPNIILERAITLDRYDLTKINVLNPKYYETNLTSDIMSNMCLFANIDTVNKYYSDQKNAYKEINKIDNKEEINKIDIESYSYHEQKQQKTCLIIAFYFGSRTANETFHNLIEIQKRYLKKYKHNLARIVFAIAQDDRTTIDIEEKDGITYFYKPNLGLSFGSWQTVINYYQDTYDHYIFSEDDYVFVKDNFDQILLEQYKNYRIHSNGPAEYLVTWKSQRTRLISTIGITSSSVLKKYNYLNSIVWTTDKDHSMWTFLNTFSNIRPLEKQYSAFPYWGIVLDRWDVWLFDYIPGETEEDYLERAVMVPVQMIDKMDRIIKPKLSNILDIECDGLFRVGLDHNYHKNTNNLLLKQTAIDNSETIEKVNSETIEKVNSETIEKVNSETIEKVNSETSSKRINLIIATYAGKYNAEVKDDILRLNLRVLNELNPEITTITIMKPRINAEHEEMQGYYNLADLELGNIRNKIRIIECENIGISYGQYFMGMYADPSYDYYILIEDDYVIFKDNFEKEFLDEFSKHEEDSLLCNFIYRDRYWNIMELSHQMDDDMNSLNILKEKLVKYNMTQICNIPDVALCLLSRQTLNKIMSKLTLENILEIFNIKFNRLHIYQVIFGYILNSSGVKIYDTREDHMNIYYVTSDKKIHICNFEYFVFNWKEKQYQNEKFKTPLFLPIQMLHTNQYLDELNLMKIYLANENEFFQHYQRLHNITL